MEGSNYKKNVSLHKFYWHNIKEIILMFKKLVSNIPFNPSLIEHIPKYKATLKRERKLRLVGLIILIFAFIAQLFITIFPAHPGFASSPNNLLSSGFSSQTTAVNDCYSNNQGFETILTYYSISCSSLSQAKSETITASSYNNQLYSVNRLAYGKSNEELIKIDRQNYWARPLSEGSALTSAKLKVLGGTSSLGTKYFILYNSGNLVFVGQPTASPTCNPNTSPNCPKLYITARDGQINDANGATAKPNDSIIFTLEATNLSKSTINNFVVETNFSSTLSYARVSNLYGGKIDTNNNVYWPGVSISPGQTIIKNATFVVSSPVPKTPLSSTDPNYYNLQMTTVYGNVINIKLPWSFNKYFELKINNDFPSQGMIFSLIISLLLVVYLSYFLYRNHLMLKELENVKQDYLNGGN